MKNFIYEKNNSGYTIKGVKSRLKNIIIPEGVTKIEGHAFCESLIESVVFPKSLTYIGEGAFEYCENLKMSLGYGIYIDTTPKKPRQSKKLCLHNENEYANITNDM